MLCYNCGCRLSEHDFCTSCGADVSLYKRIMYISNMYYNDGLARANIRDLTGAVTSLRQSLKFNKNHVEARNLLGLVYFEMGEVVAALSEWVISKNLKAEKNIADDYISMIQSNASRLDSINQTIKKYNQALAYCRQDSKDLAVIQLKKVLSLNPRFIRAHQLLALLYIDSEQWEKAKRELTKCIEMDRNNVQTLLYLQEVDRILMPDDTGHAAKQKSKDAIRYQSDNEMIIRPAGYNEPKRRGAGSVLNILLGIIIGVAAMYFLVVPAVRTNINNEAQAQIASIGNQIEAKNNTITELQDEMEQLRMEKEDINRQLQTYVGTEETIQSMDDLLEAAADYMSTQDAAATAQRLDEIRAVVVLEETSEAYQRLYQALFVAIGPSMSDVYYEKGRAEYNAQTYIEAIATLQRAVEYNDANADAWLYLGRAYQRNGNVEEAIAAYRNVVSLLANMDTERGKAARAAIIELGGTP